MSFHNITIIYSGLVFFALGNGLMWPSFMSILSKTGSKEVQGTLQGYANSLGSLASIFGLILGGFLFSVMGSQTFFISSSLLFIIFLASFKLFSLSKTSNPST